MEDLDNLPVDTGALVKLNKSEGPMAVYLRDAHEKLAEAVMENDFRRSILRLLQSDVNLVIALDKSSPKPQINSKITKLREGFNSIYLRSQEMLTSSNINFITLLQHMKDQFNVIKIFYFDEDNKNKTIELEDAKEF